MNPLTCVTARLRGWEGVISSFGALLLLTGCETTQKYSLTYKLWSNPELANWAEPAQAPHLALFVGPPGQDVLVQYDETRERKEAVSRRAYFLAQSAGRIAKGKKPHFVNPHLARTMAPVPIEVGTPRTRNVAPQRAALIAICNDQACEFWLFRDSKLEGPFQLPAYLESNGNLTRVALTPFAVAGDTVMVGIVAAAVGGYMYAAGVVSSSQSWERDKYIYR